ncbi:MAG: hypothetical protein PVSMB3_05880 [Candidatus Dormibacteraceae bacterium]
MATRLTCGDSRIGAKALAIYKDAMTSPSVELLDVSNPLKPYLACTLRPANGAHILSDTKLAFWNGDQLGMADLSSGTPITVTAHLAGRTDTGAFNNDGTKFAYRTYDAAGAVSLQVFSKGSDLTLYVQQPMGGHGGPGPSAGPFDQLAFSPDGSLLLDYMLFRPPSGPPNLRVFRADGSIVFQTAGATGGVWSRTGSTLYFFTWNSSGPVMGDLNRLDASGQLQVISRGLPPMFWPHMSPDGTGIIYNTSDSSVPDCGGVPHLWRFDLATKSARQISSAISSDPFFIQPNVVWSDEQKLTACGMGGPSYPDGVILAHDMSTGRDTTVDTTLMVPGIGGPPPGRQSTFNLLDTWFAPV